MPVRKSKPQYDQRFFAPRDRMREQEAVFSHLDSIAAELAEFYGFEKISTSVMDEAKPYTLLMKQKLFEERTPIIWNPQAVSSSAGRRNASDGPLMLRPSGTLTLLRSYVTKKMNDLPHPLKFSFAGESFFLHGIADRRTSGRMASIDERGLMMIGEDTAIAEAEIIHVIWRTLEKIGVPVYSLQLTLNAIGCAQCRGHFRSSFLAYFRTRGQRLCRNCRRDLKRFPTRILSCEEEKCKMVMHGAPQILDFLCETCKKHLRGVLEFLDEAGVPYFLDSRLFREGSWFHQFVFEITFRPGIAQDDIAASQPETMMLAEGGRVSYAGELIVGRRIDAVSGVIMLHALEQTCREQKILLVPPARERVFLAQLGDLAKRKSLGLMEMLRLGSIGVTESLGRDSMKSQLKVAERVGAKIALILGQKEALDDTVIVRDVDSGMQETVSQEKLVEFLKRRMKDNGQ